jgi:hypothetical protein
MLNVNCVPLSSQTTEIENAIYPGCPNGMIDGIAIDAQRNNDINFNAFAC